MVLGKSWALGLLLAVSLVRADETLPIPSAAVHAWDSATLDGAPAGYFHSVTTSVTRAGRKLLHTTQELRLTVRRYKAVVALRMDSGTDETADGKVVGISMHQYEGGGGLDMKGILKGGKMHVTVAHSGGRIQRQLPWNDKVIGLHAQDLLFQKKKAGPGDTFSFQSFEPSLNTVITVRVVVHNEEEVWVAGVKKRLLARPSLPTRSRCPAPACNCRRSPSGWARMAWWCSGASKSPASARSS